MNYYLNILVMFEVYALLALSANQMVGTSGLLNLSHAVFYGLGAYTVGILTTQFELNFWVAFLSIIPIMVLAAIVYSFIASKVRELYFSLATLAIQVVFFSIITNWTNFTNGSKGIPGISNPSISEFYISEPLEYSLFGLSVLLLFAIVFYVISKSRINLLIKATRDDEIALINLGKNPKKYRLISIFLSALVAGIAGGLFSGYFTFVDPESFTLNESILILSIVLIGGIGSYKGTVLGALIYVLLPEIIELIHIPDDYAANIRMIIFGLLLIAIVRFRPQGILGKELFT